jgi:hypothetical protein
MKFALVNGNKTLATKGAKGLCPICKEEVNAYCGEINVHHWRHKKDSECDHWWEPETVWHRSWKDKFPEAWQEVSLQNKKTGEIHRADVRTEEGWVIEFQYSFLNPEKRRARNAFYSPKLIWVVNGLRRPTDAKQFQRTLDERSTVMLKAPLIFRVNSPEKCRLLREWDNDDSLVFFDFQEVDSPKQLQLWFIYPKGSTNVTYISSFPRSYFIELLNKNKFGELVRNTIIPNRKELEKATYKNVGLKADRGT